MGTRGFEDENQRHENGRFDNKMPDLPRIQYRHYKSDRQFLVVWELPADRQASQWGLKPWMDVSAAGNQRNA